MTDVPSLPRPASPLDEDTELRVRVVEAVIDAFRTRAFHETDVDVVSELAGVPVETVRGLFPSWNGLVMAAVDRWNAERMRPVIPLMHAYGTVRFLRGIVERNVHDPSLMRLLTSLLNVAATPGHPMAPTLQHEWRKFHALILGGLTTDVEVGREPETMDPVRGAEQLIALYEGLQMQSMVRPEMDLLASYDRGVTRLRAGWSQDYVEQVWDLDS
ncbi:TetR/AcrR family transcriptional regulator [Frigoribacterium sp. CFBP 13729]|uniref:TetR/AcrR family transcriptional regulator n=1 Tax=unclassified Frigoribacterium TaxID=2627005 RepID=UPI0017800F77|nr:MULTISPECIES: TetR/AcrR family transcriptional regulator [unclassified Frigoribacterium]MBD8583079.1 TetR/AcrR family transcriptional regulator [Frigoribacterium sp. CFBP 8766]MBD8611142.1 TetR/AcrR family transcriptional regulator [Frigoribacterium sp. CFBP 13729]